MADRTLPDPKTLPDDLARLVRLAKLMDTAWGVPFTKVRLGWDTVMGLVPGLGDAAGAAMGAAIVMAAKRHGVPKHVIVRMVGNVVADFAIGALPLVGDVADVFFKSHKRNVRLLLEHRRGHREEEPLDAEWTPTEPHGAR